MYSNAINAATADTAFPSSSSSPIPVLTSTAAAAAAAYASVFQSHSSDAVPVVAASVTHISTKRTLSAQVRMKGSEPVSKLRYEDFGILGSNGISAGGFLVSPFAFNQSIADIQLIVYPSVSLTFQIHLIPYSCVLVLLFRALIN